MPIQSKPPCGGLIPKTLLAFAALTVATRAAAQEQPLDGELQRVYEQLLDDEKAKDAVERVRRMGPEKAAERWA